MLFRDRPFNQADYFSHFHTAVVIVSWLGLKNPSLLSETKGFLPLFLINAVESWRVSGLERRRDKQSMASCHSKDSAFVATEPDFVFIHQQLMMWNNLKTSNNWSVSTLKAPWNVNYVFFLGLFWSGLDFRRILRSVEGFLFSLAPSSSCLYVQSQWFWSKLRRYRYLSKCAECWSHRANIWVIIAHL